MKTVGIIPARYASSRFPGKPLIDIAGKSMIRRVYERASSAGSLDEVFVATDDHRIFVHVEEFGGKAIMTSPDHQSGTDRIFEAASKLRTRSDIILNIQGDEPFIEPAQIDSLVAIFVNPAIRIGTLVKRISDGNELFNPNVVKAVVSASGKALYFSRATVPFIRGTSNDAWLGQHTFFKHIGIYCFRTEALETVCQLKTSLLEKAESLEQLRWLENGIDIHCVETFFDNIAIDTPADLEKVINNLT